MKVGNTGDQNVNGIAATRAVGEGQSANKGDAASKTQKAGSTEPKGATVTLSSTASQLMAASGAAGEFDAEKVAAVRQAIEDGSYKVDPEAIADKLIANAKELLSGRSH